MSSARKFNRKVIEREDEDEGQDFNDGTRKFDIYYNRYKKV